MNRPPRGNEYRALGAHMSMFEIMQQPVPNMTVQIRAGSFWANGTDFVEFPGGSSPAITKPATGAKWVIVGIDTSAIIVLLEGTSALNNPPVPVIPKNTLPCAAIYVQSTTTSITREMIYDLRPVFYAGTFDTDHQELSGRTDVDCHPMSAITGLTAALLEKPTLVELEPQFDSKADVDGTTSATFTLNKDQTGTPVEDTVLVFERGNLPQALFRFNETDDVFDYSLDGGTTWTVLGQPSTDLVYTKGEVDTLLLDKSDTTHNHDEAYSAIDHNHDTVYSTTTHTHTNLPEVHINNLTAENVEILNDTTTEGNITFKNVERAIKFPSPTPEVYDEVLKYGVVGGAPSVLTHGGTNTNYHRFLAGGKETIINNAGQLKIGSPGGTVMGGEIDIVDDKNGDEAGGIGIASYRDADKWGSFVYGVRYRGTLAAPLACQDGDALMEFGCLGWDGANALGGGELMFTVDGAVSAGVLPTKAEIYVTKDDGTTAVGLTVKKDLTVAATAFEGDGSALTNLPVNAGTTAARPVSVATGFMYFDTDLGKPIWYNGSAWVDATGTVV